MKSARVVASGLQFPEGPIAMPDGSVLLVEVKRGTLSRVSPDGGIEVVAETGGGPNGAALGPDGAVYICNNGGFTWHESSGLLIPGHQPDDYVGGSIQRVDLATGSVTELYRQCGDHPLRGPNDLVFDSAGGMWFTDHGKTRPRDKDQGGVYYALPDGSTITEIVHPVDAPNGIGLSPDGSILYYAETRTGRVFKRTLSRPGVLESTPGLSAASLLVGLPGMAMLDSLAVDSSGYVCIGTLVEAGITVVSPEGEVEHVPLPPDLWDPLVTNICFGGPDLRTAYITLSGSGRLIRCEWPRPGLRLAF